MIDNILVLLGCILLGAFITWKGPEQISLKYALRFLIVFSLATFVISLLILLFWDYLDEKHSMSGRDAFLQFLSTYLLCFLTNIDNLATFLAIFELIPLTYIDQQNVLKIGLIGNAIIRMGMLWGSLYFVQKAAWVSKLLFIPLLYAGYYMITEGQKKELKFLAHIKKYIQTKTSSSQKALPMAFAIIIFLISDAIFAIDSTVITTAITNNYLIGQTANLMALLLQIPCYILIKKAKGEYPLLRKGLGSIIICIGFHLLLCG